MNRGIVVFVAVVALSAVASADLLEVGKREPAPGEPVLIVTPRLALWSPTGATTIFVHVAIQHPIPEFFCPAVELTIFERGDELGIPAIHKTYEGDCAPWRETPGFHHDAEGAIVDDEATGPWHWQTSSRRERWGLGGGEWVVEVKLRQGAREHKLQAFVSVRGAGDGPSAGTEGALFP